LYDDYCIFNNFIMTVNYHSFVILWVYLFMYFFVCFM
jgi:hypothetical protein